MNAEIFYCTDPSRMREEQERALSHLDGRSSIGMFVFMPLERKFKIKGSLVIPKPPARRMRIQGIVLAVPAFCCGETQADETPCE